RPFLNDMVWQKIVQRPSVFLTFLFTIVLAAYILRQSFRYSAEEPTTVVPSPEPITSISPIHEDVRQNSMGNLSGVLPRDYHLPSVYLTAPMYRLATCQIEKNMATIRDATFCFLTNHTEFIARKRTISTTFWSNKFCTDVFERRTFASAMELVGEKPTLFAVVRHPIDRFLSGYVDKCHKTVFYYSAEERCFGCKYDMRCFVEKMYKTLLGYYDGSIKKSRMVKYYVRHFAPQTWYCEFDKHKSDYILINYHTGINGTRKIADDFEKVYEQAQVPANYRATIHSEMLKGTTKHSTVKDPFRKVAEKRVLSDDYVMGLLMRMYFYDFIEFGFK
ncbi:hypothetical protein V3C99_013215, partial [Haemonchus contortus]